MNRAKLLKFLRGLGYSGADDLAAVKAWLAEKDYDADNLGTAAGPVSVDAVWKKGGKPLTIEQQIEDDANPEPSGELAEIRAKLKALEEKERLRGGTSRTVESEGKAAGSVALGAKAFINAANRKAYDRKAARGEAVFPDAEVAEAFAAVTRLKIADYFGQDYDHKSGDLEICKKSQFEYDNLLGGAFVPPEFSTHLVVLKEQYNQGRGLFRTVPMSRDVQSFPKDTGDLTVYAPGEGGSITASNKTTATVNLTAKKLGTLTTLSSEIMRDSAINVAEWIAKGIMYAFGKAEEQAFFIGDGTATYWGFTGIAPALKGLSATIANIAGLFTASSATYTSITLGDFEQTMGLLPDFDGIAGGDPVWMVNKRFYYGTMVRLAKAAGGNTEANLAGKPTPMFLGSPVKFVRSLPRTSAATTVTALFGWPELAATIGDVTNGISIQDSKDRYFDQDLIAFRGIERVAFSPHDVGNASATEASRTPGPVVGLITP